MRNLVFSLALGLGLSLPLGAFAQSCLPDQAEARGWGDPVGVVLVEQFRSADLPGAPLPPASPWGPLASWPSSIPLRVTPADPSWGNFQTPGGFTAPPGLAVSSPCPGAFTGSFSAGVSLVNMAGLTGAPGGAGVMEAVDVVVIPEPGVCSLALGCGFLLLARRRRR